MLSGKCLSVHFSNIIIETKDLYQELAGYTVVAFVFLVWEYQDIDYQSGLSYLTTEGKVLYDEPYVSPFTPKDEKRKLQFLTPVGKRLDSKLERDRGLETARERERDRGRDRDSEQKKKKSLPAPTDVDQPIDPNEPTYCTCGQVCIKRIHS